jgi:hypothetical protein
MDMRRASPDRQAMLLVVRPTARLSCALLHSFGLGICGRLALEPAFDPAIDVFLKPSDGTRAKRVGPRKLAGGNE